MKTNFFTEGVSSANINTSDASNNTTNTLNNDNTSNSSLSVSQETHGVDLTGDLTDTVLHPEDLIKRSLYTKL